MAANGFAARFALESESALATFLFSLSVVNHDMKAFHDCVCLAMVSEAADDDDHQPASDFGQLHGWLIAYQ